MLTAADLMKAIEDRLNHALENADEFHGETLRPYDEGFADGLEAAIGIIDGVFYEFEAMLDAHSPQE